MATAIAFAAVSCAGNPTATNAVRAANRQAEAAGSPYRWEAQPGPGGSAAIRRHLIGEPSTTAADAVLSADVVTQIQIAERRAGSSEEFEIAEVRRVSLSASGAEEVWVVQRSSGQQVAYFLTLRSSSRGGVDIDLKGPWD